MPSVGNLISEGAHPSGYYFRRWLAILSTAEDTHTFQSSIAFPTYVHREDCERTFTVTLLIIKTGNKCPSGGEQISKSWMVQAIKMD